MKNLLFCFLLSFSFATSGFAAHVHNESAAVPADEIPVIVKDIIGVVGLKANFEIKVADIPNAAAITYRGKRFIAYNPRFFSQLNAAAGNKWATVSVLAHEIGHHLNGHTLTSTGSLPPLELEADEFSGFVLQKMGATLTQAQAAMKFAASYRASNTHPARHDRLEAIARGFNKAGTAVGDMAKYSKPDQSAQRQNTQNTIARVSPRVTERKTPAKEPFVLDKRYVLAAVDFPSDRSANYYVTKQFNFVKVFQGQLYLLGKMLRTSNPDYPFVMKSDNKQTLFVNRSGKILTSQNKLAGYIRL